MRHYDPRGGVRGQGEDRGGPRSRRRRSATAAKNIAEGREFGNNTAADLFAVADDMLEGEILVARGEDGGRDRVAERGGGEGGHAAVLPSRRTGSCRCATHSGAVLLNDGQAAAAEKVYREDLRRWPDNGWSLHGLAASLDGAGEDGGRGGA